ncbi:hypothetical protein TNCV_2178331 [Trichonephila clavipes]|uniref:Uncharacterized protein n=1 Tax=Trichonephila clavipes TaxID=2585209 RepID=A0A8X6VUB2_TRICX|nr:hypothetical protein TNCV_2178331 [Trichonephila clavipes]
MVPIFKKTPLKSAKSFSDETIGLATEKEALASVSCIKNKPGLSRSLLKISICVLTKTAYHMVREPISTINCGCCFILRNFIFGLSVRQIGKTDHCALWTSNANDVKFVYA